MKYALVLFAALAASPALSQSTEEPALADVINMPQVAAAPPLGPGVSTRLPEDVYYVITSQKPFVVIFSPDNGSLSVSTEPSPLQLRGRFVEDPTKKVTRNFTDKYIVVIEAAKTGSCELLVIPGTVTKPSDVIRRLIDAEIGPRPPPIPPPVPPGPVPPGPTPPDGPLGLTKASREGAAKVSLPPAAKAVQAQKLAAAHRSLKSALAAGAYNTQASNGRAALAAAILADKRAANNAAVGAEDWKPWASQVDAMVSALYQSGQISTVQDWQAALEELAVGLGG